MFGQFLNRIEVIDCSCFDPVVILFKSMDCFFFFFVKNAYFSEKAKSLEITSNIKTIILIYEKECLIRSAIEMITLKHVFTSSDHLKDKKSR